MFSLKKFVKRGLIAAIGKMEDYQVILNAAGWQEKGVLSKADLAEIEAAIDAQYAEETTQETTEEATEE